MLKQLIFSFGLVSATVLPLAARADVVSFDPDGLGPDPAIPIDAFDFFQGNILSKDGVTAVTNFTGDPEPLTAYSHARLSALLLGGKAYPNSATLRLNTDYEISYVAGFPENLTGVFDVNGNDIPDFTIFALDKAPGPEATFFELWWSSPRDTNDLEGTGFNNGILILKGRVVRAFSDFFALEGSFPGGSTGPVTFDKFETNNYPGVTSTVGAGNGHPLTVQVLDWDENFFTGLEKDQVLSFNLNAGNVSNNAPFTSVDPSKRFTTSEGGGAPSLLPQIAPINGVSGPDFQFQTDINAVLSIIPVTDKTCRMTGGGVTRTGDIILDEEGSPIPTASGQSGTNRYTFGGQIGAPSATQPTPFGEWTHHQFQGDAGDFVFHAGTHSAPPETKVLTVSCVDPGFCQPARPAPFKQLNWEGIGQFKNVAKSPKKIPAFKNSVVPGVSLHWVKVHYEDLGEPGGPNGAQTKNADCPDTLHKIGDIVGDPTVEPGKTICANCPDVYQISIYAKDTNPAVDKSNKPIYQVGGYMDHGNIQLHPAIK